MKLPTLLPTALLGCAFALLFSATCAVSATAPTAANSPSKKTAPVATKNVSSKAKVPTKPVSKSLKAAPTATAGKSAVAQALSQPENKTPDQQFLIGREAARKGDRATLTRLASELADHELAIYLSYWRLIQTVNENGSDLSSVQAFLSRNEGEYPAERLRIALVKELSKRGQWEDLAREASKLQSPELESQCLLLQSRLLRGDETAIPAIRKLWNDPTSNDDVCQPLFDRLASSGALSTDDIWQRVHRLVELNRLGSARQAASTLPSNVQPDGRQFEQATERSVLWVNQAQSHLASSTNRHLLALALQRIARSDPSHAASHLRNVEGSLNREERARAWSHIALQGAKRLMPEAYEWYKATLPSTLSEENAQWRVRTALRAQDWGMVKNSIEDMPTDLAARPEWVYWLGRAYKAGGRTRDAEVQFSRIAGQTHFYGNLADEELGKRISIPAIAQAPTLAEQSAVGERVGIRRALAWFRLDLRSEGVKEWNWALRGMNDRELLAAAELARQLGIFDRAITAADRTKQEHNFGLRYLAPYSDEIRAASRNQSIDDAWVYGLMRQESRFITSAKSNVGAAGLMQLMPATAKWVAHKIGLKNFSQSQVHDTQTNVLLGTTYMRLVLENLDNHPVLASAAYNAGPGRARKWRAEIPLEGAIYAESIPFAETRDYVKKVMSNAVYYSALFNGRSESLRERLGTIPANGASNILKDTDLP
jgi:soluble lytic murein transglycosylase